MSDWPVVALGDLVEEITVGFVGSMTHEYVDSGVPFFRSKNISEYEIVWNDIRYISDKFHKKLKKSTLRPGDVAIVRTGKPGTTCVIPETITEANCSDIVIVRVNDEKLSAHYLSYFMNSMANNQVASHLVGAVQQHFNVGSAKKIEIPLPSRDEQEKIVKVLKDLDDKRKLNRQINQTLEQIAQAIFKSWFVDFEPTRAKIAAKQAGQDPERAAMAAISGKTLDEIDQLVAEHDVQGNTNVAGAGSAGATLEQLKTTASLFPDALVGSELGNIPEGWEIMPLDQVAYYQNGLAMQKFRPENENDFLPVLKIAQLKKGFADGKEKASPNIKPECTVDNGDVVFSWSGSLLVDIWCGGKVALNQHLFKVTSTDFPKWFYYLWTKHHLERFQQIASDKAVTMGHIKRSHLKEAMCVIPVNTDLDLISNFIDMLIERRLENFCLEELRDTLLPELLLGKGKPG